MRRFVKELDWTLLSSHHNLHEEATERTTLRNPHLPSKRARQGEVEHLMRRLVLEYKLREEAEEIKGASKVHLPETQIWYTR